MINDLDRQILTILQSNARTSNAEIARQVGLAPSAVFERIRKLEERGVLQSYTARIDPHAVGLGLVAFTFVRSNDRPHVAGEDCFLVKFRAADTEALGRLLRERLGKIGTITSTRTTIVLETVKETAELPIAVEEEREAVSA